jgi:nucleoid-associated protein YgaU
MQSIERYGVIALLFLVVTVVAVLMWDTEDPAAQTPLPRADMPAGSASQGRPITAEGSLAARADEGPTRSARPPLGAQGTPAWAQEPVADGGGESAALAEAESAAAQAPESPKTITAERPPAREEKEPVAVFGASAGERPKSERLHLVRSGDTLGEIAQSTLGSSRRWPEIAALNPGLDPSSLRVGTRIVLPGDAAGAPRTAAAASPEKPAEKAGAAARERSYRVRDGDSLWRIAERELGDGERWRELVAANRGLDPDRLTVGAVLALPAGGVRKADAPKQRAESGETVAQAAKPKASARKGRVQ